MHPPQSRPEELRWSLRCGVFDCRRVPRPGGILRKEREGHGAKKGLPARVVGHKTVQANVRLIPIKGTNNHDFCVPGALGLRPREGREGKKKTKGFLWLARIDFGGKRMECREGESLDL